MHVCSCIIIVAVHIMVEVALSYSWNASTKKGEREVCIDLYQSYMYLNYYALLVIQCNVKLRGQKSLTCDRNWLDFA